MRIGATSLEKHLEEQIARIPVDWQGQPPWRNASRRPLQIGVSVNTTAFFPCRLYLCWVFVGVPVYVVTYVIKQMQMCVVSGIEI